MKRTSIMSAAICAIMIGSAAPVQAGILDWLFGATIETVAKKAIGQVEGAFKTGVEGAKKLVQEEMSEKRQDDSAGILGQGVSIFGGGAAGIMSYLFFKKIVKLPTPLSILASLLIGSIIPVGYNVVPEIAKAAKLEKEKDTQTASFAERTSSGCQAGEGFAPRDPRGQGRARGKRS